MFKIVDLKIKVFLYKIIYIYENEFKIHKAI